MPVVIVAFSFGRLGARPAAASKDGTSPGLGPRRHTEGPVRAPSALLVYISGYRAPPWHTASALSQLLPLRGPLGAPPEARRRSRFGSNSPTMCPHGDLNCDDKKQTGTRSSHAWREVCKRQACIRQKLGTARTGEEDGRSVRGEEGDK